MTSLWCADGLSAGTAPTQKQEAVACGGVSPLKLVGRGVWQLLKPVLKTKKGSADLVLLFPATPDCGALECPT